LFVKWGGGVIVGGRMVVWVFGLRGWWGLVGLRLWFGGAKGGVYVGVFCSCKSIVEFFFCWEF